MSFTIGSLFDGSGGFPLAAFLCGGVPVWASEVEPYPIAVTKTRFPYMKHLGSVTDIKGNEVDPVDVITFGSPCQDLSVAGKRAGLKHTDNGDDETTRSGLFMEAVRIIKEMREATGGKYPRFALWENVPGAFSSNKGEDFRVVCEELIKIVEPTAVMPAVPKAGWAYADHYCGDGWSLAYRVFDAQYWGVPQRRRRIYLVLDLGGQCAGKVSFERESLRGYFTEGRTPWQGIAGDAERGSATADCEGNCVNVLNPWDSQGNHVHDGTDNNIYPCLRGCGGAGYQQGYVFAIDQQGGKGGANYAVDVMPTICSDSHGTPHAVAYSVQDRAGKPGGGKGMLVQEDRATSLRTANYQYIFQPTAYSLDPLSSNSMKSKNPHSGCHQTEVARTIDTTDPNPSKNQGGIAIVEPLCMATQQGGAEIMEDKCPTITAAAGMSGNNQPVVCYDIGEARLRTPSEYEELSPTITARCGTGGNNVPAVVLPILDDQGGSQISVREDGKCPTLRAEMHGNIPCVMEAAGFKAGQGAKARSIGWQKEVSPSLAAEAGGNSVPSVCYCYDARGNGDGEVCPTITGDHNNRITDYTSVLVEPHPIHDQATRFSGKRGDKQDGKGNGLGVGEADDPMFTLTGGDRHAIAYSLETFHCVAEEDKTAPLKARDYKDPICVAIDRAAFNQGQNAQYVPQYYEDGTNPTLVARGPSAVAYGVDCRNAMEYEESNGALQAACNHNHNSNNVVRVQYIVRRLTPTECARLQGFADRWATPDEKSEFTDEEYRFWLNVRNTHAEINGKATKEYTKDQMLNWYNKLPTDSSEYKLWGNGIALPTALYMMQGIAEVFE